MKIRTVTAIISVRIFTFLLRLSGSGGTSLPGRIALFFNPDLLMELAKGHRIIVVTGTNGKTTTSRIISNILTYAGFSFFENKSGANLVQGITASFAMNCTLSGKPLHEFSVIECDEAAFMTAAPMMQPEVTVVTNLFRDQLDRYGEISHMLTKITNGLKSCPGSTAVLNADDSLSYSISSHINNKVISFGINEAPYGTDEDFISDAPFCIRCKSPYEYSYRTYGHLGDFRCPSCGYNRRTPDISASDIRMSFSGSTFIMDFSGSEFNAEPSLPGAYNIYNVLAASAAVSPYVNDPAAISKGISTFESGFGRMEKIDADGMILSLVLVKNPAGLNQVINFLSFDGNDKILVFILNDRFADGTDISWIWDANFEKVAAFSKSIKRIYISGTRAEELQVRLKYANVPASLLCMEKDYLKLIENIIAFNSERIPVFVLPTYTAMFDFRKAMGKKYNLRKFWR